MIMWSDPAICTMEFASPFKYSSARYINPLAMKIGSPHPVIRLAPCTKEHVKRCATTLQILAGTYMLQSNRANFNQHENNPTCLLCKSGPEDREHMVSRCKATEHIRAKYRQRLSEILHKHCERASNVKELLHNPCLFASVVLDCTSPILTHIAPFPSHVLGEIIACCQQLTHSLSAERLTLLQKLAPLIRKKSKKRQKVPRKTSNPMHKSHNFSFHRSCTPTADLSLHNLLLLQKVTP